MVVWKAYYMKEVLMDHQARATEQAPVPGMDRPASVRDFLVDLLTATVVKREGKKQTLQWQKQLPPGRIEYQAKLPGEGRALYVTIGTDQELGSPVVRVQLRGPGRKNQPGKMDKVLTVYDLDVESDTGTRETFDILRQAVASQVAANERQSRTTPRVSQIVEMRAEIGAEETAIVQQYLSSDEQTE